MKIVMSFIIGISLGLVGFYLYDRYLYKKVYFIEASTTAYERRTKQPDGSYHLELSLSHLPAGIVDIWSYAKAEREAVVFSKYENEIVLFRVTGVVGDGWVRIVPMSPNFDAVINKIP